MKTLQQECMLFIGVLLTAPWCVASAAEDPGVFILVQGRVQEVRAAKGDAASVTVEITRVYMGDSKYQGMTFRDVQRGEDPQGMSATVPFKLKEEGLWSLVATQKGNEPPTLIVGIDDRLCFGLRSRSVENKRHKQAVKLAETVAIFEVAKPDKKAALLRELAQDETPELSYWAVARIAEAKDPASAALLADYAAAPHKTLPVAGQIAFDVVYCEKLGKVWLASDTRKQMLIAWAQGKHEDFLQRDIYSRINLAIQRGQMDAQDLSEFAKNIITSEEWTMPNRRSAVKMLGNYRNRGLQVDANFDWVIDLYKKSPDLYIRRIAASILPDYSISPERKKVIEELIPKEDDPRTQELLRAVAEGTKQKK